MKYNLSKKRIKWFDTLFIGYWSCMFLFVLSMGTYSCRTNKAAIADKANQAEIKRLKATREAFPCDTITTVLNHIDTLFVTLAGDTVKGNGDTVTITQTKMLIKYVDKIVVDRAAEKEKSDSIKGLNYQFDLMLKAEKDKYAELIKDYNKQQTTINSLKAENSKLKPWKSGVIVSGVSILALVGIGIFLKLKSFI